MGRLPDPRLRQRAPMFVSASRGAARVVELVDAPVPQGSLAGRNPRAGSSPAPGSRLLMTDAQLPNKRLKLTAPGFGRGCVCALASSVVVSINLAPPCLGAAA